MVVEAWLVGGHAVLHRRQGVVEVAIAARAAVHNNIMATVHNNITADGRG
eukprot:COSAG01_NODE_907_length_12795_cov_13.574748_6_plen_50_part_00